MPAKQEKKKVESRQRNAEDLTFGLKNKNKSAKVQKYVQQVLKQAVDPGKDARLAAQRAAEKKRLEEEKKRAAEEMAALMRATIKQPPVPPGVDPKSILCEFFKQNCCTKGTSCKFSHDLNIGRKGHKIDLFTDQRDIAGLDGDGRGMEGWTQEDLEKAVNEKFAEEKQSNKTAIVCKHFLDAVEKRLFGFFWVCPGGGKECKYRHALPPGYVMKSELAAMLAEEAEKSKDISELVEEERSKLDKRTPLTQSVFLEWRKKKDEERAKKREEERVERSKTGKVSGRELFETEGFVAEDDETAETVYEREVDDDAAAAAAEAKARKMEAEARENMGAVQEEKEEQDGGGGGGEEEEEEEFDDDLDEDLEGLEAALEEKAHISRE